MIKSVVNLVIQIVMVIAVVVVFSYFDPFGLLSPKKKKLEDTPITVSSIREIGELVTAEYYGEVLSSLQDTLIAEVQANDVAASNEFVTLNEKYILSLKEFYLRKDSVKVHWLRRRKELTDYFYEANSTITNNIFYQDMIELILKKFNSPKKKYDSEGDLLLDIWKEKSFPDNNIYVTTSKIPSTDFKDKKNKELNDLTSSKAFKKRQIIVLGRGWVRAGINFGKFTDRNFKYDRNLRTVYLIGVKPSILNCDINPWFIPEQKVKGFEIIVATNKANDPNFLVKVKTNCLNKLRAQAESNGILSHAKVNAEESLKHFFSLLLSEPIDEVKIMENSIETYNYMFPKDSIVKKERLQLIDSMLLAVAKIDRDSAYKKAEQLSKMKWDAGLDTLLINRYSNFAYKMSEDEFLSSNEYNQLAMQLNGKPFSKLDSLWFFPYRGYDTLLKSTKKLVPDTLNYKSEKVFWIDSVLHTDDYEKFTIAFDSILRSEVLKKMNENREAARSAHVLFLRNTIKTIKVKDKVIANTLANVQSNLDSLKSK